MSTSPAERSGSEVYAPFTKPVVHGDGRGAGLGYPTANFAISPEELGLAAGVYAAEVVVQGKLYHAALVVQELPWKVEAHLLDYQGRALYGEVLTVRPKLKVSEVERQPSLAELKEKIRQDLELVRQYFQS